MQPESQMPALPGYELEGVLGEGGQGRVIRALHLGLNRRVVLKFLRPELLSDAVWRGRFLREAKVTAALDHTNIVQVLGIEEAHGAIVYEWLEGASLAERLWKDGAMPAAQAMTIAHQAALGLAFAHRAGIVHRDIKPDNLFVTQDGTVKVLDFGLARPSVLGGEKLTQEGTIMGTPAYMPPEQARGESVGELADVYSLGATRCTRRSPAGRPTPRRTPTTS